MRPLSLLRLLLVCSIGLLTLPGAVMPAAAQGADEAPQQLAQAAPTQAAGRASTGGLISAIRVVGNERIETGTIISYMSITPGDPFDPERIDRSLKTLYATGLFGDVQISRDGSVLVVRLAENPVVNRIAFEGNHSLNDDALRPLVQLKPRSVFTAQLAQADRQRILDAYAKKSRYAATVEPKIIRLDQNRVDVVFEIQDGESTLIGRIAFIGNKKFSEERLREVINSREEAWWRILSTSDNYDPERSKYDQELLRRFYLKNGYADFVATNGTAELSPDRRSFLITYVIEEGARYTVGSIDIDSKLRNTSGEDLKPQVDFETGDWYDGDALERSVKAMALAAQQRGNPFAEVNPRIKRNPETHTIDIRFDVADGPRVYIERLNITGNTRTRDKVIRRELVVSEGDAYNNEVLRTSRQRLQDIGYFSNVTLNSSAGTTADRTIIDYNVEEKSTGELSLGGGYSTDIGALLNVGLRERNLVGTGIDASINGLLAQRETQISASVTDPYFLDRNLAAGVDAYDIVNNNQFISQYNESRLGFTLRAGYSYNQHLSQSWNYSLVDRNVYNVAPTASIYVINEAGYTLLSQLGTALALDYRDSRLNPHTGYILRAGIDYAGLGGNVDYIRFHLDAGYWIPLDRFTGNSDWGIQLTAGAGYLDNENHSELIIDRFFLGGDNLRGFQIGGAGPHDINTGDSLGGRNMWTQSTELHFPLPISPDLGLTGRAFVDVGALWGVTAFQGNPVTDYPGPRVGAGIGVGWNTPFGLINLDLAQAVVKYRYDKTQVFRFGFGTRF